ncbi:MAG: DUF1552 domain-containing protein [Vicinamibacterales bacterium]
MSFKLDRRTALRGLFSGTTMAVALPYLDCFLSDNGNLLASGAPLPTRFGTWFWGLGCSPGRWHPDNVGADYDLKPELSAMAPFKKKVTVFKGFDCLLDGKPNFPHGTGGPTIRTGTAPGNQGVLPGASFDNIIAGVIGSTSRFRTLDVSGIGDRNNSLSGSGAGQANPPETSAARLYQRIFGEGFTDPNSAEFVPDPFIIARKSVLSVVKDQRLDLEKRLGVADRQRLDQYFTGIRQVESQLAIQLQQPEPLEACTVPSRPEEKNVANELEDVVQNHEAMVRLLAMALACNQTKVFNVAFNNGASSLTRRGSSTSHHQLTHDEPRDPVLGYQPQATKFVEDIMKQWALLLQVFDSMPEGDGTLLDHMLIVAHSETELASNHNVSNMPIMLAGLASGKVKSGLCVDGKKDPVSRIGLTAMQIMGVPIDTFGTQSLTTKKTISEILV